MFLRPEKTGGQDWLHINVHEEHQICYWTQEPGVSREQLETAVKAAGMLAVNK